MLAPARPRPHVVLVPALHLADPSCLEQPLSLSPEHPHPPQLSGTGDLPGYPRSEVESRERGGDCFCQAVGSQLLLPGVPQESSQPQWLPTGAMSLFSQAWQGGWSIGARSEMDCRLKGQAQSPGAKKQLPGGSGQKMGTRVPLSEQTCFPWPNEHIYLARPPLSP